MTEPLPVYHSKATASEPERAFLTQWRRFAPGYMPEPQCQENGGEVLFATDVEREFRFDFAWPELFVAVEIDGGQRKPGGGRHAHDTDREKHNCAVSLGWRVLRYSPEMVEKDPIQVIGEVVTLLHQQEINLESPDFLQEY